MDDADDRKALPPGQYSLCDALGVALHSLVDDATKAMKEQDEDYDAWYRRQRWELPEPR
jgi:hypothetical protein